MVRWLVALAAGRYQGDAAQTTQLLNKVLLPEVLQCQRPVFAHVAGKHGKQQVTMLDGKQAEVQSGRHVVARTGGRAASSRHRGFGAHRLTAEGMARRWFAWVSSRDLGRLVAVGCIGPFGQSLAGVLRKCANMCVDCTARKLPARPGAADTAKPTAPTRETQATGCASYPRPGSRLVSRKSPLLRQLTNSVGAASPIDLSEGCKRCRVV